MFFRMKKKSSGFRGSHDLLHVPWFESAGGLSCILFTTNADEQRTGKADNEEIMAANTVREEINATLSVNVLRGKVDPLKW